MRCFMLLLCAAACGGTDAVSTLPAGTIIIQTKVGVTDGSTTIRGGSFIAWRSVDGQHHSMASTSTPAVFTEMDVPAGGTSTEVKLPLQGSYGYFCTIHGADNERGSVQVLFPTSLTAGDGG